MTTEFIIHRGCLSKEKENTINGIREIMNYGKNLRIEIDVSLTSDGSLILNHDMVIIDYEDGKYYPLVKNDINSLKEKFTVSLLNDVLSEFPNSKFLLDLRHDSNPVQGLNWIPPEEDYEFDAMIAPLKKVLSRHSHCDIKMTAFSMEFCKELDLAFPTTDKLIPERATRVLFQAYAQSGDEKFLSVLPNPVMIQSDMLTAELANKFSSLKKKIITTPSPTHNLSRQIDSALEFDIYASVVSCFTGNLADEIHRL